MEEGRSPIKKLLNKVHGGIFGLVSAIVGGLLMFIAVLHYPGYSIYKNMVSDLGVGPGGIFFNLGLILSGIISIPYYLHLADSFVEEDVNQNLRKGAVVSSVISCIAYSFVGVFPAIESNKIYLVAHGTFAVISLASGVSYLVLFGILMYKSEKFTKIQSFLSFLLAGLYLSFLLTWRPIVEWTVSFFLIVWIVVNSTYMLKHNI